MKMLELRVPPLLVMLLFGAAMALVDRMTDGLRWNWPGSEVAAAIIAATGVVVIALGVIQFRRARTTVNPVKPDQAGQLVTGGIFERTRNPMYLGMTLILTGFMVYLENFWTALGVAGFVWYITRFQIIPEEAAMRRLFAQQFVD